MKHLRYLLMAALVAMPLTACDEDDDTPVIVEPDIGTIAGTVSVAGTGLAGIDVTLVGATSQSVQTSSSGAYTFANVEAGSYGVTISNIPAGVSFSTTSKTTAITTDGQTVTVDFTGSYIETSSITGTVTVAGQGINGVTVALTGTETGSSVSANGGNFTFTGLRAGSYTVTISNIPTGYTFQTLSYAVTLGVGEAKAVAFVGEEVVTVDPVTAEVVIKSVTTGATNVPVNPAAVVGQIDVTLQIDPGENDLNKIALLLDGVEVASQALATAVAGDVPMEQGGIFEVVFSVNTAAFNTTTGAPTYVNKAYAVSAELGLDNAEQASVSTSTTLTFANADTFIGNVTAGAQAIGTNGLLYYDAPLTVDILPVAYSGKTVSSVTATFSDFGGSGVTTKTDGTAPFQVQWTATNLTNYQTPFANLGTETIRVTAALYSDGTVMTVPFPGVAVTGGTVMTIDNTPPAMNAGQVYTLPEQVSDNTNHPISSANNWVRPAYTFSSGFGTYADNPNGVDVGTSSNITRTFRFGTAAGWPGTATARYALPAYATPGESGLGPSMVNTEYRTTAFIMDRLGNWAEVPFTASVTDNPLTTLGHDAAAPTGQAAIDPDGAGAAVLWPDKLIINATSAAPANIDGLSFTATEDRAGFSATPLRMWLKRQTSNTTTSYLVGRTSGDNRVNEAPTVTVCGVAPAPAAPANGSPCLPANTAGIVDAYYYFSGHMVDQAGNEVATNVDRMWLKDVTVPTTQNVTLPPSLVANASAAFSAPVSDNLDLWEVAFGFDFGGDGVFLPFGENVQVGDGDRWNQAVVMSQTAQLTLPKAVVARERTTAATVAPFNGAIYNSPNAPDGAVALATNVRAITEDAAGNLSAPLANNFIAGTVDAAGAAASYTVGAGTTATGAWNMVVPAAGVSLCNGQGTTACAGGNVTSTTLTATALGISGIYPNPFGAAGKVFFYVQLDGVDGTYYTADDQWFLLGSVDAASATFTDDGAVRTYSFSFNLTSAMVASIPNGTVINVVAIGFNGTNGTALVSEPNANITVVNGA